MNASTLRGLAVLAVLALAPKAFALSVTTQTFTVQEATFLYGGGPFSILGTYALVGGPWEIAPAGPNLVAIQFSATIAVQATSIYTNIWDFPVQFTPEITVSSGREFFPFSNPSFGAAGTTVVGDEVTLGGFIPRGTSIPSYTSIFEASINQTINLELTQPAQLAAFSGNPLTRNFHIKIDDDNSFASIDYSVSATASLTYVYSTPDGGTTAALLAFAFTGLCLLRKRCL